MIELFYSRFPHPQMSIGKEDRSVFELGLILTIHAGALTYSVGEFCGREKLGVSIDVSTKSR